VCNGRLSGVGAEHPAQGMGIKSLRRSKGAQTLVAGRWLARRDHSQLWAELPSHQGWHGQQRGLRVRGLFLSPAARG